MATETATLISPPRGRTSARRPNYVRRTPPRHRKSVLLTIVMAVFVIYSIVPLVWLVVNATKDQTDLFSSFGLWFGTEFNLWQNIVDTLTYRDGIFVQWFGNTLLYVIVGAGGATALATVAGYGMAEAASDELKGAINGFAAGALLVMLSDSMIPEARAKAGLAGGLVLALGFAVAAGLA